MKHFITSILLVLTFASCDQPAENLSLCTQVTNLDEWNKLASNLDYIDEIDLTNLPQKYVSQKGVYWENGSTIRVAWVGGNSDQWAFVIREAERWSDVVNLRFEWDVPVADSDIRIGFRQGSAWSYVGVPPEQLSTQQTMNFGWLSAITVIHEFGHMLGLYHEHQNPNNPVPWNRQKVIADASGPPNNWALSTIEGNILSRLSKATTDSSPYNRHNPMGYPYDSSWTLDGSSGEPQNRFTDDLILFGKEHYPFEDVDEPDEPIILDPVEPDCREIQAQLDKALSDLEKKQAVFRKLSGFKIKYTQKGAKLADAVEFIDEICEELGL